MAKNTKQQYVQISKDEYIELLKFKIERLSRENESLKKDLKACKNTLKAFLMTYSRN